MADKPVFRVMAMLVMLAGCAAEPVVVYRSLEVKVPVPVYRVPPAALLEHYAPATTEVFISPLAPTATTALSEEGLNQLKTILRTMKVRDDAWRAWSSNPSELTQ